MIALAQRLALPGIIAGAHAAVWVAGNLSGPAPELAAVTL